MLSFINFVPRVRRVAMVLLALVVIKHAYSVVWGLYNEKTARKLIKSSEVALSDLREVRDMNFRKLHGRITNKS